MSDQGEKKARDLNAILPDVPLTLSGIPRVEGTPPETPVGHLRNALQLLKSSADWECVSTHEGQPLAVYMGEDVAAIVEHVTRAVEQLERKP